MVNKVTSAEKVPRVVILVPFSSKDESRIIIWKYVKNWLESTLKYPIFVGDITFKASQNYNISLARNQASQLAGNWDIAIICDADTIIGPEQIEIGVKTAQETGAITYPFTERWELNQKGTEILLNQKNEDWRTHVQKYELNQPLGGCMIVRRDLWDLVRGFDTGFEGWGHEDGAFALACQILSGEKPRRVEGKSFHLEHVFSPIKNPNNPVYIKNRIRIARYQQVAQKKNAKKELLKLRDETIPFDKSYGVIF